MRQAASGEPWNRFCTRPFLRTAHLLPLAGSRQIRILAPRRGSSPCWKSASPAASSRPRWMGLDGARGTRQMGATRSTARVRGAPLFVLIRRLLVFPLPGPGERKGRVGSERPAAPSPCWRGPEAPRPRAHPRALWSRVGCGAGLFGVGERRTSRTAPPCASGRGHSLHNARKCRPGARDTRVPHVRPRPPSRQSRGLWAIHRFSRPAMPFLLPPLSPNTGRETPVCPDEGASGPQGSFSPGLPSRVSPGATGSGMVLVSPTDRVTTVVVGSSCR